MYQLTLTASETLVGTAIAVSLCETGEDHRSEVLATWTSFCADQFDGLPPGTLEAFLEQTSAAFVNSASSNAARL